MTAFARTDHSIFGKWWWTVDRWTLAVLAVLMGLGIVLVQAASPAVAERIGLDNFHFVQRHILTLVPACLLMVGVSLLTPRGVRRTAVIAFIIFTILLALTMVIGFEIKGARRWIHVPGLSIQPSEFVKPAFAVVAAWLFAHGRTSERFPGAVISIMLYLMVVGLLMMQPDFGMTFVVSVVWFGQFFLAGLPIILVAIMGVMGIVGLIGAYMFFPHVSSRINRFLDPAAGDNYQVTRSLEAFQNGGAFGTGPGQGSIKMMLPDAHADFIFAVAGEELGLFWCLVLICLFAFIVIRGFMRVMRDDNLFIVLAVTGLLTQFGLQAWINMASSLHLMPTKGMTLPFISYGGSSLLALGLGMGMVLALTRKRFGGGDGK
jgi:cell division protein FtsW